MDRLKQANYLQGEEDPDEIRTRFGIIAKPPLH